jgi:single-stranded-DNA-specific exonuclease
LGVVEGDVGGFEGAIGEEFDFGDFFYGKFELIEQKVVGEKHLKCRLKLTNTPTIHDAIAFFQPPIKTTTIQLAYKLSINEWRGNTNLQLMVEQVYECD